VRGWAFLLSGLIVWTVHFFALYAIASIFLTTPLARALTILVTLLCLGGGGWLLLRTLRSAIPTPTDAWMRTVALLGLGLSGIAIVWQAMPALLA
jgi:hypothetical protein